MMGIDCPSSLQIPKGWRQFDQDWPRRHKPRKTHVVLREADISMLKVSLARASLAAILRIDEQMAPRAATPVRRYAHRLAPTGLLKRRGDSFVRLHWQIDETVRTLQWPCSDGYFCKSSNVSLGSEADARR